mgnify:CR=1 FL=1
MIWTAKRRIDRNQFEILTWIEWVVQTEDEWAGRDEWKKAISDLTQQGKVAHWGISVNRWEPDNSLQSLSTDLFSAVQVIYNIFDQTPETRMFPAERFQ